MRKWLKLTGLLGAALAGTAVLFVSGALAAVHEIATTKTCTSPVKIGDPYACQVQVLNVVDSGFDTVRLTGLSDVVHSSGGDIPSGNILSFVQLVFSGAVVCTGGTGTGTSANPYVGATECLLPFGSSIRTTPFSHYTVQSGDFNLPTNRLTDTATVNWNNTCVSDPDSDCTTAPRTATADSFALVQKLQSSTSTTIHNAAHQPVVSVDVGSTVHDFVTVTGQPGSPIPTGNVNIDWFLNNDCSGSAFANSGDVALAADGQVDAIGFAFTVNSAGFRAFRAHYGGDARYLGSDGACEPLVVGTPPPPDSTKPTCLLKDSFAGPPHGIHISVQDTGSGLKSVMVKSSSNSTTLIPPFTVGTTAEVVVTASRTNDAVPASVTLSVKDVAGNETICDPVLTSTVRSSSGQPASQTFSGLLQGESKVTIMNGDPGMARVTIDANGVRFRELSLEAGQVVHVDVASAMHAGSDNTITITARGKKGASADVIIADS